ncbi:MAG: NAD(P)-dependent oxidoreductase, partial [Calditrichia bacterium]|nr:NAD(P)-dependent oxidoreductase [Calditrichia bacterium]
SNKFPVTIVRLAAIFSDWCEYGPLYVFLSKWLSKKWDAKILAGKGNSAVPYLHVRNLVEFFKTTIEKCDTLPQFHIAIASPNGCTSHKELFEISRRYFFGQAASPFHIPKWFAYFGVLMKDLLGKAINKRPFERPWMIKYVDLEMEINATATHNLLNWKPVKRLHILRRLLFQIEKMKSNPFIWHHKNEEALHKNIPAKCNLIICETMFKIEQSVVKMTLNHLMSPQNKDMYPSYQKMDTETLTLRLEYIFRMIKTAIRTGDRMHILSYAHNLAEERIKEKYKAEEVISANRIIANNIVSFLSAQPSLKNKSQWIYDEIMMTIQLIEDEIEDTFEEEN